jgi:hypothetical protein
MSKQRNNIARLDFDSRMTVSGMLMDGASYGEIRAALAPRHPGVLFHNSSFQAYAKSEEHKKRLAAREKLHSDLTARRIQVSEITEGRGIESAADLAMFELLEQIRGLQAGEMDVSGAQKLAASVVALKRSAVSAREASLKADFEKREAQLQAAIMALEKEVDDLRGKDQGKAKGLSPEALKKIEEQAGLM